MKGLCFTCDEKYSPDCVCKNRHHRLMVLEDELKGELNWLTPK